MKTDIEIANSVTLKKITEIGNEIGISENDMIRYGNYMAKIEPKMSTEKTVSKLILVTAINPTPAGEGKTTISIGLADGMKELNKKVALALREPSLGPVFGIKGGATGGGYSQIAPMEDINLHFTGDMHAITAANNLLSAMIDNHIYWGNSLKIKNVTWHRCLDVNDRALRNLISGINNSCVREDSFDITAASEIMAILCLSQDLDDLKNKLDNIIIGENFDLEPISAKDLKAGGAMAILLKDAIKPNLVQSLGSVPSFVHGGPFANIAHGCNSIIATKTAMNYADYVVTEAGFGADLGAEKFFDIKCRTANLNPSAVVIVATIKALKCAGGKKDSLSSRDDDALKRGIPNLLKHIENITKVYNLPCVVALNKYATDEIEEMEIVKEACKKENANVCFAECFEKGGKGAIALASEVVKLCEKKTTLKFSYDLEDSIEEKIFKIATKIYGANEVKYEPKAKKVLEKLSGSLASKMPICIAKTQYSLSDNPLLVGKPQGFTLTVKDMALRAGAGFVVALCGDIMLMPGLGRVPNAENMSISGEIIKGLF